jgi:hypothetical protein
MIAITPVTMLADSVNPRGAIIIFRAAVELFEPDLFSALSFRPRLMPPCEEDTISKPTVRAIIPKKRLEAGRTILHLAILIRNVSPPQPISLLL